MTSRLTTRLVGAASVVALTGGTLGVLAPAGAATGSLAYTCPVLGTPKTFTMVADTDAPRKIAYGETITPQATGTVTVPEDVTQTLRDLQAQKVDGTANVAATTDGAASPWTLAVPSTTVPPNGSLVLVGTGPAGTFEGNQVGTVYDLAVGNFTATLNLRRANGDPATVPQTTIACTLNAGQDAAVDTIKVVKDTTSTTANARDINNGAKAKTKVKVKSEHGTTPKGKIKAKLVRGGKVWQTKVLSLRDGKRTVTFQRLHTNGTFKVKVKYVGRDNWKGSRAVDTFVVG